MSRKGAQGHSLPSNRLVRRTDTGEASERRHLRATEENILKFSIEDPLDSLEENLEVSTAYAPALTKNQPPCESFCLASPPSTSR
jgi:hypothetical protein